MKLTLAICTFQRQESLAQLLRVLADQELTRCEPQLEIDVLVVDNEPNAKVQVLCQKLGAKYPVRLHYRAEKERGVSQARNTALEGALENDADFVAFIDDDDLPGPDWLRLLWREYWRSKADIVFGTWILSEDLPSWVYESGIFSTKKTREHSLALNSELPKLASTCNVLLRASWLQRMKSRGPFFDPALGRSGGEDKDFFIRAHNQGASFACARDAYVVRGHQSDRYQRLGVFKRGFKNGSSRMGRKRRHEGAKSSATQLICSLRKLLIVLFILPFSLLSQAKFMHQLYRLGKITGVLYAFMVRKDFDYYGCETEVLEKQ